jgi:sec-independent protein translocase protein TatA
MPVIEPGHLWMVLLLLVVVLVVWGPGKLPDVGSGLGRALSEFRSASRGDSSPTSKDATEESGSSGS